MNSIKTLGVMKEIRQQLKDKNKKVVFTNGCFDLIHAGHIDYLSKAKAFGDVLIIGLNSDASVKRIKGSERPILKETERGFIHSNLKTVDYGMLFDEYTPKLHIEELLPAILVKGADCEIENIVGKDVVLAKGGEVKTIEFVNDQSTSKIIKIIVDRFKD